MQIHILDMLHVQDNYNFVLRDEANELTAVVDPSEAKGIIAFLEEIGWRLDYILNTHHHWDHSNGNPGLKERYGCKVVGNAADAARIRGIDMALSEGECFVFGDTCFTVIDVSGHTIGHIAYYNSEENLLFCGDALFAMGCGRMFEGTPEMYAASLAKIKALPEETVIYPAHEYTIPNGRFARNIEPDNPAISEHIEWARARRREGLPSIPTTLAREKATNPFLRLDSPAIRERLEMPRASDSEVFAALRARKDAF